PSFQKFQQNIFLADSIICITPYINIYSWEGQTFMQYLSFVSPSQDKSWGVEDSGIVYDLGPSGANLADSLKEAIAQNIFGNVSKEQLAGAPGYSAAEISYLPPIDAPEKILCIGVNYHDHRLEGRRPDIPAPTVFTRF